MVTSAATPATEAARRNILDWVRSRRRRHSTANQAARPSSAVPKPTMTSQARWTIVIGGRAPGATDRKPPTRVLGVQPDKDDADPRVVRSEPRTPPPDA